MKIDTQHFQSARGGAVTGNTSGPTVLVLAYNKHIQAEFEQRLAMLRLNGGMGKCNLVGSPEQEEIWRAGAEDDRHLVTSAVAGSGKTTTAIELIARLNPTSTVVKTYHGVGYQAIMNSCRAHGVSNVRINEYLLDDWMRAMGVRSLNNWRDVSSLFKKLVGLVKGSLIADGDTDGLAVMADHRGYDVGNCFGVTSKLVWDFVQWSGQIRGEIGFDDMPWLPVRLGLTMPKFDLVIVDEAQDTSPIQGKLVELLCPNGRVVILGDKNQAIYGFRGADVEAINNLRSAMQRTRGVLDLGLTYSRRSPQVIAAMASAVVPQFKAMPDAIEGEVVEVWPAYTDPADREELRAAYAVAAAKVARAGDMVLCRVNGDLIAFAYECLKRRIKVVIKGRDFGAGLVAIVQDRLRGDTPEEFNTSLWEWYIQEKQKLERLGERGESQLTVLMDKFDCFMQLMLIPKPPPIGNDGAIVGAWGPLNPFHRAMCSVIEGLFADVDSVGKVNDGVVCGTVHKMKGLEADRVMILRTDLLPHPMAKHLWEQVQENNLAYVAITRAKRELVLVGGCPAVFRRVLADYESIKGIEDKPNGCVEIDGEAPRGDGAPAELQGDHLKAGGRSQRRKRQDPGGDAKAGSGRVRRTGAVQKRGRRGSHGKD